MAFAKALAEEQSGSMGGVERMSRLTDIPLPSYSFVPGRNPHPVRDPQGHRFGMPEIEADGFPSNWADCESYLYAVDLFNAGFYWEAHEFWEAAWNACGRSGDEATLLKALIKIAAAGVKLREGQPLGTQRHLRRAAQLLNDLSDGQPILCGMYVVALREWCDSLQTWSNLTDALGGCRWGDLRATLPGRLTVSRKP